MQLVKAIGFFKGTLSFWRPDLEYDGLKLVRLSTTMAKLLLISAGL